MKCLHVRAVFAFWLCTAAVNGQHSMSSHVTGELAGVPSPDRLVVELESAGPDRTSSRAEVNFAGEFEFKEVEPGIRRLRVLSSFGHVIREQSVMIDPIATHIRVRFPETGSSPSKPGAVSLRALRPVPKDAQRQFRLGEEEMRKGVFDRAIAHLTAGLAAAFESPSAWNNLALCHLQRREYAVAELYLRHAASIDPQSPLITHNLAVALGGLGRYAEAEAAARAAIRLGGSIESSYLLARLMCLEGKYTRETLALLRESGAIHPEAHLAAAQVAFSRGAPDEAAGDIYAYFRSGDRRRRHEAQSLLGRIRQYRRGQSDLLTGDSPGRNRHENSAR